MKLQNTIAGVFAIALCAAYQPGYAQDTQAPAAVHETGGQMYPSHFQPWPPIKMSDVTYKKRLWEDIDLKDDVNKTIALADTRKPLLKILVDCIIKGKLKAYSAENDRFTHELTKEEFLKDFNNKHTPGLQITKYAIKEDYLILKSGEKTTRILGIAPLTATTLPDGTVKEEPMFWVYYPNCRLYLSEHLVDNDVTWGDIFEKQQFTGTIKKVSSPDHAADNAGTKH